MRSAAALVERLLYAERVTKMGHTDLTSDGVLVRVPLDFAEVMLGQETPDMVRPAPGVRDNFVGEIAAAILVGEGVLANTVSLIMAREYMIDFARRLVHRARQSPADELALSCRVGDTTMRLTVRSADQDVDVVRMLDKMADVLSGARRGEHE